MGDVLSRLRSALAGRYTLERELGRGGMATVWLAEEQHPRRRVALKVLDPAIAQALGPERFLREVDLAAKLTHPHILPIYTAGDADGLLYYTMPYVEGESLRDRLNRENQLPLDDALQVAREVADALSYAHSHDVIHRDIKPENILLEAGHAVVADFGIARAITAAGGEQLTETGIAVGTPAYMSPEQGSGDRDLDGRSDIYSLGCVLYEMLAGHPPFTGSTAQEVLARHSLDAVPLLTSARPGLPRQVERAIDAALAKVPADRFRTATLLGDALRTPFSDEAPPTRGWPRRRLFQLATATVVLIVVALGLTQRLWLHKSEVDPNLIAVMPFRVTGDPELAYLRDGLIDLLYVQLHGDGGVRTVNPATLLSAWRRRVATDTVDLAEGTAVTLARSLGAGKLLLGGVVATPTRVEVNALIVRVPDGREQAFVRQAGPPDSLPSLVDRLVLQLVARIGGEADHRLPFLTSSLPALRAYLKGQAAYRRGEYSDAVRDFAEALSLDSNLVLAALRAADASGWLADGPAQWLEVAWSKRSQLSRRDRAYLEAKAGPLYPTQSAVAAILPAWERAVALAPDQSDVWHGLGEALFHWGGILGLPDWPTRAAAAFGRTIELDSTFGPAFDHLANLAMMSGDTTTLARLATTYLARHSEGEVAELMRWYTAWARNDDAQLETLLLRADRLKPIEVFHILVLAGQSVGRSPEHAERALSTIRRRAVSASEMYFAMRWSRMLAISGGRPREASFYGDTAVMLESLPGGSPGGTVTEGRERRLVVLEALYAGGDTAIAARAVAAIEGSVRGFAKPNRTGAGALHEDLCVLEQWRLRHGDTAATERVTAELRENGPTPLRQVCPALLHALRTALTGGDRAAVAIDELEALLRTGPGGSTRAYANLVLAALLEGRHERARALEAVRRRTHYDYSGIRFLPSYLREQGRLAALSNRREEAIKAYQHYVALRPNPEPEMSPDVERVKKHLARLLVVGTR